MIASSLLNFMQPAIGRPSYFVSTAKDIWDVLVNNYLKKENATWIFDLKRANHETK